MTCDRVIIRGDLTTPYFHLYAYKAGERVDSIGVLMDDLAETAVAFLRKYELTQIDLSGPRSYMKGPEIFIKEAIAKEYSLDAITFKYV